MKALHSRVAATKDSLYIISALVYIRLVRLALIDAIEA